MRRIVFDRLDLDLRGVAPATAEAAARLLGPALARAIAHGPVDIASADRIDGGRIAVDAGLSPEALAQRIAQQIVDTTTTAATRRSSTEVAAPRPQPAHAASAVATTPAVSMSSKASP